MKEIFALVFLWISVFSASVIAGEGESWLFHPELYAFENGVRFATAEDEARSLKALGYSGIAQVIKGGSDLANRIATYDKAGLKVLSLYLNIGDKPINPELVRPLANSGAMIELTVRKRNAGTVAALRQTAEMAARMDIRVVLYPHYGHSIATMQQALDLIEEVNHPNLGVMFNLCHFLKSEEAENLEVVLEKAKPQLFSVSTSGADLDGKTWDELIQRLDQGTFPQERLFKALKQLKYEGPVCLQSYNLKGDKFKNLETSWLAWEKILKDI